MTTETNTLGHSIPPGMMTQAIRFSLPLEAIKWEDKFELARLYNNKFNVHKYIWAYESKDKKEKENNPHLHCYLILPTLSKSTKSDFINKKINHLIRRDSEGRLMHCQEKEILKLEQYQAYIIKDGNYITNFTKEEIEYVEAKKESIKEDCKLPAYKKLYNRIKEIRDHETEPNFWDLNAVCHSIIKIYIEEWDKPPPYYKLKEYALYIGYKMELPQAKNEVKAIFWMKN
jgi:hypothetical protein